MKKPYFTTLFALCLLTGSLYAQLPSLNWATNLGGSGNDEGYSIAIDDTSNVYTLGFFEGTVDFDPSASTFNLTSAGANGYLDIFISKLDRLGKFVWAKRIGNAAYEVGYSITLDINNNIYITGAFQGTVDFNPGLGTDTSYLTSAGLFDVFVLKLNNDGTFGWARSMGGVGNDYGYSIDVSSIGNVTTTGLFNKTADFYPGSLGTYNLVSAGASTSDIFVSTLDSSGNFLWAKQMGGTDDDLASSVVVDIDGNIYTTGNFKGTADFNPDPDPGMIKNLVSVSGLGDCFISKLDPNGNYVSANKLGGENFSNVVSNCITSDYNGNIYLTGSFSGTVDFDLDPFDGEWYETGNGRPNGSIFIVKYDPDGKFKLVKNLGNGFGDTTEGNSVFVDRKGKIYVTGTFWGTCDFDPAENSVHELSSIGATDIFISSYDSIGGYLWAIPFANVTTNLGRSIVVDSNGSVFSTGVFGIDLDFDPGIPTNTVTSNGLNDAYVVKLCQIEAPSIDGPSILCQGDSILLTSSPSYSYLWSNGETTRDIIVSVPGNYEVIVTNSSGCSAKSVIKSILPKALPNVTANTTDESVCLGSNVTLTGGGASTYTWTNGITNGVSFGPSETAIYTVIGTDANGCHNSDSIEVTVNPLPIVFASASDTSVCSGESVTLNGGGANTYAWSNGITNGIAFVTTSTTNYSVTGTDINGCQNTATIDITVNPLPVIDLGTDIELMQGQDTLLFNNASGTGLTYLWSNGAMTDTIRVDTGTYTVTVTSSDGCTASDEIEVTFSVATRDLSSIYEITVTPNPAHDYFNIICMGGSTSLAQIIDNLGKVVSEDKALISDGETRTLSIDILPSGMYYVRLSGDKFTMTVPVIKN